MFFQLYAEILTVATDFPKIPAHFLAAIAAGAIILFVVCGAIAGVLDAIRKKEREEEERRRRGIIRLRMQPGLEVFTPSILPRGAAYRIIVAGTYTFRHWGAWYNADAFYNHEDLPYEGMYLDGRAAQPVEIDRAGHAYVYAHTGAGRKLSISLRPHKGSRNNGTASGRLIVDIIPAKVAQPLSQTSLSHAHQQQIKHEREAKEQAERERIAEEQKRLDQQAAHRQADLQERRQELKRRRLAQEELRRDDEERRRREEEHRRAKHEEIITRFRIQAELDGNFLNVAYRRNLAKHHTETVLAGKHDFSAVYYQLTSDLDLLNAITTQAPVILDWLKGHRDTIQRAERIKALPPAAPEPALPALPPRQPPRLTEAEVRARKQYRIKRTGRDMIADRIARDDLLREYAEELDKKYPDMEEDEKQQRINEFAEALMDDDDNDAKKIN